MTNFLKSNKSITSKDIFAVIGVMTIIVVTALIVFTVGAKTALALEPYVKGYDIAGYELCIVHQGENLYEIAEEHMENFPETGRENRVKCYAMLIQAYNSIYEPSKDLKWGDTIKLPIVEGSAKANVKTVG